MAPTRFLLAAAVLAAAPGAPRPVAADPAARAPISGGARTPAESAAWATVQRWLAAQNGGRFDDYAALYAPSFQGVKRVGKTTKKLNRAAWLKDRKAMFRAPMTVAATQLVVTTPAAGGGPVAELTQTWASGAFADTGQKRLVFSADGQAIVAEEMLTSRVMLTEAACLTTLFPGASWKKRRTGEDDGERAVEAIDVVDLGGRWACAVELARDGGRDVTVGVLVFGKKWEPRGTLELDYDVERDPDNAIDVSGDVALAAAQLHDKVPVLQVTRSTRRDEPGLSSTEDTTTLYRADGDELGSLVTYQSSASGGETDETSTCELEVDDRRVKGWPDLTVTCTERKRFYHGEDPPETEEEQVTRYRWDGATYAER